MQVTRRDLIKAQAVSAAATVIGISVPGAQALAQTGGSKTVYVGTRAPAVSAAPVAAC
jgi:anaerobic selenocysteine-containing dehydrogenase